MRSIPTFLIILLSTVFLTKAEELTATKAEAIYNLATLREKTASFLSYEVKRDTKRGPATVRFYYKVGDDGIHYFRSDEECLLKGTGCKITTTVVRNREGYWSVVDGTAVKAPALIDPSIQNALNLDEITTSDSEDDKEIQNAIGALREAGNAGRDTFKGSYEKTDGAVLVTVEVQFSKENQALQQALAQKQLNEKRAILESLQLNRAQITKELDKLRAFLEKIAPVKAVVVIDPAIPFILEKRLLNAQGAVIKEKACSNIQIKREEAPPDSFFSIPVTAKRYFPTDITDYQSELKRAWRRQMEKQRKQQPKIQ